MGNSKTGPRNSDTPKVLTLLLSYACNLDCSFCGQKDFRNNKSVPKSKLTLREIESILDDAATCGVKNVNIWGGEPFLHSELFEIIEAVAKRRMRAFLVTNGSLLSKKAAEICASKLSFMRISIDAPFGRHDAIRNVPGLFEKISEGVRALNERKRIFPIISSCTVIFPGNIDILEETVDAIFGMGIPTVFFQFIMSYSAELISAYKKRLAEMYGVPSSAINRIDAFQGPQITREEFQRASVIMRRIKKKYGNKAVYPDILNDPDDFQCYNLKSGPIPFHKTQGCWSLDYKINIEPNGDVVGCPDFPDLVYGNVFSNSIMEIWNSKLRREVKEDFYSGKPLSICYKCCQISGIRSGLEVGRMSLCE